MVMGISAKLCSYELNISENAVKNFAHIFHVLKLMQNYSLYT